MNGGGRTHCRSGTVQRVAGNLDNTHTTHGFNAEVIRGTANTPKGPIAVLQIPNDICTPNRPGRTETLPYFTGTAPRNATHGTLTPPAEVALAQLRSHTDNPRTAKGPIAVSGNPNGNWNLSLSSIPSLLVIAAITYACDATG